MRDTTWLAGRFEENRSHLQAVAYRMLGSTSEAEDAVQEGWLRLSRSETGEIGNLGGWLTTVVARICLDMLRARKTRADTPLDEDAAADPHALEEGPESERQLADAMGPALMVVLELLNPAERIAFVLHDLFALPFDEIAGILGRSPESARQLASRARRRVQGKAGEITAQDKAERRRVVDAFLTASRKGDFQGLVAILDPDVLLRADAKAVQVAAANKWGGAPVLAPQVRGAKAVAETFLGRAKGAQAALIDGVPGAVWAQQGQVRSVFAFAFREGKIAGIDLVMDPESLGAIQVEIISD
jgi:RNA polymerase sigma-70 factor (ECF subfamily)